MAALLKVSSYWEYALRQPDRSNRTTTFTKQAQHLTNRLRPVTTFYRGTIDNLLTHCITAWYRKLQIWSLQRMGKNAERINGVSDIYRAQSFQKVSNMASDPPTPLTISLHY